MKCSNCGTEITTGNTCPNCGALNIPLGQPTDNAVKPVETPIPQPKTEVSSPIPAPADISAVNAVSAPQSEVVSTLGIDEDSEEEKVNITANMAAPELAVNEENLTANVGAITSSETDESYDPNQTENISTPDNIKPESNVVTFDIPPVNQNTNTSAPSTGIQEITGESTVGDVNHAELKPATGKKKLTIKLGNKSNLVFPAIVVLALIFGILIGKTFFSKTLQTGNCAYRPTNLKTVADGSNNVTVVEGYKYKIPTDYTYDKNNSGLYVYASDASYRMFMRVYDGSYDDFSNSIESIKATLIDNGYSVNDSKELKYGEKRYVLFEVTTNLQNRVIAYTDAIEGQVTYVEVITSDNTFNYDPYEAVNDILINAEKQESIPQIEKIDTFDIYSTIKKTVDSYTAIKN